jgi:hypothetical protein
MKWDGPYEILQQKGEVNFEILQSNGKIKKIHHNQLKKYFSPVEVQMDRMATPHTDFDFKYYENDLTCPITAGDEIIEEGAKSLEDELQIAEPIMPPVVEQELLENGEEIVQQDLQVERGGELEEQPIRRSMRQTTQRTCYDASTGLASVPEQQSVFNAHSLYRARSPVPSFSKNIETFQLLVENFKEKLVDTDIEASNYLKQIQIRDTADSETIQDLVDEINKVYKFSLDDESAYNVIEEGESSFKLKRKSEPNCYTSEKGRPAYDAYSKQTKQLHLPYPENQQKKQRYNPQPTGEEQAKINNSKPKRSDTAQRTHTDRKSVV